MDYIRKPGEILSHRVTICKTTVGFEPTDTWFAVRPLKPAWVRCHTTCRGLEPLYPFGMPVFETGAVPVEPTRHSRPIRSRSGICDFGDRNASNYTIDPYDNERTRTSMPLRTVRFRIGCCTNWANSPYTTPRGLEPPSRFLATLAFQTSLLPIRVQCHFDLFVFIQNNP